MVHSIFWAAMDNVLPGASQQRCWFHKSGNVLNELPKRLHTKALEMMREMYSAESRTDAGAALEGFRKTFSEKHEKAVGLLEKDWDELTAFFDFPAKHWQSLRPQTL